MDGAVARANRRWWEEKLVAGGPAFDCRHLMGFQQVTSSVGGGEVRALADGLKDNRSFSIMDIVLHTLDEDVGWALAEILQVNTTVTSLAVEFRTFDNAVAAGATALADGLKVNTTLRRMKLSTLTIEHHDPGFALATAMPGARPAKAYPSACWGLWAPLRPRPARCVEDKLHFDRS